jgi:hypothetical protein
VNNALCAAGRTQPDELLSLVMDGLAEAGLDVQRGEGSRLAIDWPGAQCQLAVSDWGAAEWEFWPQFPAGADPGLAADAATTLLTGCAGPFPRLAEERGSVTFKGAVGRELKARGLEVTLAMYADEVGFDAFAEVVATIPGRQDDAQVRVADDGGLTWIREYQSEAALSVPDSDQAADPASVAAAVVEAVTRAMTCLRAATAQVPGGTASGPPRHGQGDRT